MMSIEPDDGTIPASRIPELSVPEEGLELAGPGAEVSDPATEPDSPVKSGSTKKKKKKKKEDAGSKRGVETMFRTSYRVNMDLSALADTKANIMISINGIIISIIIASISPKIDTNPWLLIPTAVLLFACLISIVYAVLSARPRITSGIISLDDVRRDKANILFFGQFTSLSQPDFVTGMSELIAEPDRLYQNMIRDIYGLGSVLQRKFRLLRVSYTVFMFGLTIGILLFIGVYIWIVLTSPGVPA